MKHVMRENRLQKLGVALLIAIFAGLIIAQLAWAGHTIGHMDSATLAANPELSTAYRYSQGMLMEKATPVIVAAANATEAGRLRGIEAAAARYAALGEAYRTGKLAFFAPGR